MGAVATAAMKAGGRKRGLGGNGKRLITSSSVAAMPRMISYSPVVENEHPGSLGSRLEKKLRYQRRPASPRGGTGKLSTQLPMPILARPSVKSHLQVP